MDKLLDKDREEFMREQNSKIRPDEQQWEEIDFNEQEFRGWQKKRFDKTQEETAGRVREHIQASNASKDMSNPEF